MKLFYIYDEVDVDAPALGIFDSNESASFVLEHFGTHLESPSIKECDSEPYIDYNYIEDWSKEPENGVYYFIANIADNCVEDCCFNTMDIAKDYILDNEIEEYEIRGLKVNSIIDWDGVLNKNGEMERPEDEDDIEFYNLVCSMKEKGIQFEVTKGYFESEYGEWSF